MFLLKLKWLLEVSKAEVSKAEVSKAEVSKAEVGKAEVKGVRQVWDMSCLLQTTDTLKVCRVME